MSAGKAFFDTNVLLYAYSDSDAAKQVAAMSLYREYAPNGRMLVSTQVVQEFYVSALRKLALPHEHVREIVFTLLDSPLVTIGASHIRTAMDFAGRYRIWFWDALILTAAEAGGAEVLYTEDLNDGQQYGPVVVRNPFRSSGEEHAPPN